MGIRFLAAAGVSFISTIAVAAAPLQTIALSGTDSSLGPQLGGGMFFSGFSSPKLNSAGAVAFSAGVTPAVDGGIWLRDPTGIRPIALTDTDGPLGPAQGAGVMYQQFNLGNPALNNSGAIAFSASTNRTPQYQGIWQNTGAANDDIAIVRTDVRSVRTWEPGSNLSQASAGACR